MKTAVHSIHEDCRPDSKSPLFVHNNPTNKMNPFIILGVSSLSALYHFYINCCKFNLNSTDPDQTPRPAASDLGLYY